MEKKYVGVEDYIDPIIVLLRNTYHIRPKHRVFKPYDWKGPDVTISKLLAGSPSIKQTFGEKDWLDYYFTEGRHSPLEMILLSLYRLGFQRGYLCYQEENGFLHDILDKLEKATQDLKGGKDEEPKALLDGGPRTLTDEAIDKVVTSTIAESSIPRLSSDISVQKKHKGKSTVQKD